mmetsp:Transcript_2965/g.7356  ORF Transcript_2965/g.7356 Transcript_2965/m.7356 type:complete len:227 (+) Transcript_2965:3832-4512(+)
MPVVVARQVCARPITLACLQELDRLLVLSLHLVHVSSGVYGPDVALVDREGLLCVHHGQLEVFTLLQSKCIHSQHIPIHGRACIHQGHSPGIRIPHPRFLAQEIAQVILQLGEGCVTRVGHSQNLNDTEGILHPSLAHLADSSEDTLLSIRVRARVDGFLCPLTELHNAFIIDFATGPQDLEPKQHADGECKVLVVLGSPHGGAVGVSEHPKHHLNRKIHKPRRFG